MRTEQLAVEPIHEYNGKRNRAMSCPVALALNDKFPDKSACVNRQKAWLCHDRSFILVKFEEKLIFAIDRYDRGFPFELGTYTIEIYDF